MQVSVESMDGLTRRMSVELPAEQVDQEIDKRLKKLANTVKMDGFRPGKVPLSVVRRQYGGRVRQEVFGELVQSSFYEAVSQEQLHPAGEPTIQPATDDETEGMSYTATFEVLPEITLADLKGVPIEQPAVEITDTDIDGMIEKLRKQQVTWNPAERPAQSGDQLRLSFKGAIDDQPFEGGEASDVPLVLGSGAMIPGFEDGLLGMRAGETRVLELSFPDNYRVERLSGKPVSFEVEVSAVAESELPAVDEEFARGFGVEDGTLDGLRKALRGNMEREARQAIRSRVKKQVMDALIQAHEFDVPRNLVQKEAERMREQARSGMQGPGQANFNLPISLFEEQAGRRIKLGLILADITSQHGIEVDADRLRTAIEELASSYEQPEEMVKWYYANKEQMVGMESMVLEDQVVDWALERMAVEEKTHSFDDLMNPKTKGSSGASEDQV